MVQMTPKDLLRGLKEATRSTAPTMPEAGLFWQYEKEEIASTREVTFLFASLVSAMFATAAQDSECLVLGSFCRGGVSAYS